MIDDPDIFRAATLLIDQHGIDAPIRAAQRADKLLDDGDMDGAAVWRRIFKLRRLGAWDDGSSGPWDIELLENIVAVMEAEIVRRR